MKELLINNAPFRRELYPFVAGSNPSVEPRRNPNGSTNHAAIMVEEIYLYEGPIRDMELPEGIETVQPVLFTRQNQYTDGTIDSGGWIHYGLKTPSERERFPKFVSSATSGDPLQLYRFMKLLELLPGIQEMPRGENDLVATNDYYAALRAAYRSFYSWEFEGEYLEKNIEARNRIRMLVGNDNYRRILKEVPPQLDDMIDTLRSRDISVSPHSLEQELAWGRIKPSERYDSAIQDYRELVQSIADGIEETGGRW